MGVHKNVSLRLSVGDPVLCSPVIFSPRIKSSMHADHVSKNWLWMHLLGLLYLSTDFSVPRPYTIDVYKAGQLIFRHPKGFKKPSDLPKGPYMSTQCHFLNSSEWGFEPRYMSMRSERDTTLPFEHKTRTFLTSKKIVRNIAK